MKLFLHAQIVCALLAAFTFAPSLTAQDQASKVPVTYNYRAVNFPNATATQAYGISNSNEVVGFYTGAGCSQQACGFSLLNGTFTTIECALENSTDVFDISFKTGEIVGTYSYFGGVHGFMWKGNGSCFDIVDPNGPTQTNAWGVNDNGDIVGYYIDAATNNYQGFEYANGAYTTISCSGWAATRAYGINDAGLIVGDVSNSTAGPFIAFVSKGGQCTTFNVTNSSSTFGRGINDRNQITGFYTDSIGTHGFVEAASIFQTLNYPGASGTLAYHGNDQGLIAGFYSDGTGNHGFVAIP